ncbi:DUF6531 domain-containing protein [Microbulbifer sp. SA54]|uniref:DUF6531 domain-containing protein n=1 Tax=Microbulbifer sp. SA54 TaxID=3401577 RepID=UPI003AABAF03
MTPERLVDFIPELLAALRAPQMPSRPGDALQLYAWISAQTSRTETVVPTAFANGIWPKPPTIRANEYSLVQAPRQPHLALPANAPIRYCNYPGCNHEGVVLPALDQCDLVAGHVIGANGELAFSRTDFILTGPFTFRWQRFYRQSQDGNRWQHTLSEWLRLPEPGNAGDQKISLHTAEGRIVTFDMPAIGHSCFNRHERLLLSRQSLHSFRVSSFDSPDKIFRADGTGQTAPLCEVRDAFANTLTVDYQAGRPHRIVTSWGRILEFIYQDERLVKIIAPATSGAEVSLCQYGYDEDGDLSWALSANTREEYRYGQGELVALHGSPHGSIEFSYDRIGRCHQAKVGGASYQIHWQQGRNRCLVSCDTRTDKRWQFNGFGRVVFEKQQDSEQSFLYDHYGNLCQWVLPDGQRVIYRRDELGRLTRHTGSGIHRRFVYDDRGRLNGVGIFSQQGDESTQAITWTFTFGEHPLPLTITDPSGNQWLCDYDERGQLRQLTDPEGGRSTFYWDAQSQLTAIQIVDQKHTWQYDSCGRVTAFTSTSNTGRQWHYDASGVLTATHFGDQSFELVIDSDRRICGVQDGTGALYQWQYDDRDQVRQIRCHTGQQWNLGYDVFGQLKEAHVESEGQSGRQTGSFSWEYNGFGQPMRFFDTTGRQRAWLYDACGRVMEYQDGDSHWYLRYDQKGALAQIRNNSGEQCDFHFDPLGRLTQAANAHSQLRFHYDKRSLLISEHHDFTDADSISIHHDYDGRGWLKSSGSDNFNISQLFAASGALYGINANGAAILRNEVKGEQIICNLGVNRVEKTREGGVTTRLSLDPDTSWHPHVSLFPLVYPTALFQPRPPAHTARLDERGNIIEQRHSEHGEQYSYQYDGWGLMHSAESGNFKAYFRYDPFGRRYSKSSTHRRSGRQRRVYHHWWSFGIWREHTKIDQESSGCHYVFDSTTGIPLARVGDAGIEHYVADDQGNLLALLDAAGKTLWTNEIAQSAAQQVQGPGSFRGSAGVFDSETALYYRNFSYWDDASGQYLDTLKDSLLMSPSSPETTTQLEPA